MIKYVASRAFYLFLATKLINSIIQEHNVRLCLSYDNKFTLKAHVRFKKFCHYVHNVVMVDISYT